jgi:hypothetical protein
MLCSLGTFPHKFPKVGHIKQFHSTQPWYFCQTIIINSRQYKPSVFLPAINFKWENQMRQNKWLDTRLPIDCCCIYSCMYRSGKTVCWFYAASVLLLVGTYFQQCCGAAFVICRSSRTTQCLSESESWSMRSVNYGTCNQCYRDLSKFLRAMLNVCTYVILHKFMWSGNSL